MSDRIEGLVIGCMMLSMDACYRALQQLTDEHFAGHRARVVFRVIRDRFDLGDPVDLVMIDNDLSRSGRLADVGYDWLSWAYESVPAPSMLPVYVKELERLRVRRAVELATVKAGEMVKRGEVEEAQALLEEAARLKPGKPRQYGHRAAVQATIVQIEREREADIGWSTGFPSIDASINGLQPGRLYVLTADTGGGKSAMALQWALQVAQSGGRVHYWSREMRSEECIRRLIGYASGVPVYHRAARRWSDQDRAGFDASTREIADLPILFDHTTGDLADMLRQARRQREQVALYVVDHAQLVRAGKCQTPEEEIRRISGACKSNLALECNAAVVLLSQMNRSGTKGGRDQVAAIHALKGSSALEQDADCVIEIRPPQDDAARKAGPRVVQVHKNRSGAPGKLSLFWNGKRVMFRELGGDE